MKRASYIVLFAAVAIAVVIILSPGALGISNNPCSACHGSYYQYLDILEGSNANQIPTTINVGETKSVTIEIENDVNAPRYTTLSGVSVSLNSQNGHFSVATPTYNIGNLPAGIKTVTWQITGVSAGPDTLMVTARGTNSHLGRSFSDSYSPSPTITVSQSTPTPTPSTMPTPTPGPTPTPSPSSNPNPSPTPVSNSTATPPPLEPTQTPTPEPTPAPQSTEPTATPAPQQPEIAGPILISLSSPATNEVWQTGTENNIIWKTTGANGPVRITIEYSTLDAGEPWNQIANGTNISSLTWTAPDTPDTYYIRAVAIDSANPTQTASSVSSIKVMETLQTRESVIKTRAAIYNLIVWPAALVPGLLLPAIEVWRTHNKSKAKKVDIDTSLRTLKTCTD